MRATQDMLDRLHSATTQQLLDIVTKGVPVVTKEGVERDDEGNILYVPAAPAYFAQAVKLLKDNGIEVVPTGSSPMDELAKKTANRLPTFDDDVDADDVPTRPH